MMVYAVDILLFGDPLRSLTSEPYLLFSHTHQRWAFILSGMLFSLVHLEMNAVT